MSAPESRVPRCCLCKDELFTSKGKTRQKNFFSDACTEETTKLKSISAGIRCDLLKFINRDSILCYTCLLKLGKIVKYEKAIKQIESDLSELLIKLNETSSSIVGKRLYSDAVPSSPEPKRSKCAMSPTNSTSPAVSINIGSQKYSVKTPTRKQIVKKYARRNFGSFTRSVVSFHTQNVISILGRKVKDEFNHICSSQCDSIIMKCGENIKTFSWNALWIEVQQNMPVLATFLESITPCDSQVLNSVIICMLLKRRHQRMALMQRLFSAFLYANRAPKHVYASLQPLMLCQSYASTLNTIDAVSKNFDQLPKLWRDNLVNYIQSIKDAHTDQMLFSHFDDTLSEVSYLSDISEYSYDAPPWSPIRSSESDTCEVNPVGVEEDCDLPVILPASIDQSLDTEECDEESSQWPGFKLVGDNVDKNFHPAFQRIDNKTNSMHAFHLYAVKDRVDLSSFSDVTDPTNKIDVDKLLINDKEIDELNSHMAILLSRILLQHFEQYSSQRKDVSWHIPSIHVNEMSKKSKVVPLGVLLRNENKIDEMCEIMDKMHEYVPCKHVVEKVSLFNDDEDFEMDEESFHQILFGGDQLTVARARGSIAARQDHFTRRERLEGLMPVIEDWHAKQCLLKAVWKHLYKKSSAAEKGTLSQFKCLLGYAGPIDPDSNMKSCEDFLLIVLHAHVVSAAKRLLSLKQYSSVMDLARAILTKFTTINPDAKVSRSDKVHLYAREVLTLGLIWHSFNDAVREGDGDRVLTLWKFLLIIFKVKGHRNYCKEAVVLLSQYHCLLSQRKAAQLKWSRFVNTAGRQGKNVSCDLHLEHLNRTLKGLITDIGSSVSGKDTQNIYPNRAINRAARSIGVLHDVCKEFEQSNLLKQDSDKHSRPSSVKDINHIVDVLNSERVFEIQDKRKHHSFQNMNAVLQQCPSKHLKEWISAKLKSYKL